MFEGFSVSGFDIVDLQKEYWSSVVKYTIDTVKKGLTPNPDIMCNLLIKFGAFNCIS